MSTVVEAAAHFRAFQRPDGQPLRNMRDAVNRVAKRLAKEGQLEIEEENGRLMVRKIPGSEAVEAVALNRRKCDRKIQQNQGLLRKWPALCCIYGR
jgi:hypothetical protein